MVLSRLPLPGQTLKKLALAIGVAGLLLLGGVVVAKSPVVEADMPVVPAASLPAEARQVDEQIRKGGPYAYAKDGSVFGNRERLLPANARGYYREYTVVTPGSRDRGARRIVCGGRQPAKPDACYYTGDHYASFARIAQ